MEAMNLRDKRPRLNPFSVVTIIGVTIALGVALAACTKDGSTPSKSGASIAAERTIYPPVNDVEGSNYNARLKLADQPATILWCSIFPTNPNAKPFTVPIVGKLTSSNKRPTPSTQVINGTGGSDTYKYNPELPGPDGMMGTSAEYRYGFDPAGNYVEVTGMETYCTTVPDLMQRNTTIIQIKPGTDPGALDAKMEAATKACRAKDSDPTHPCPAAMALLGNS